MTRLLTATLVALLLLAGCLGGGDGGSEDLPDADADLPMTLATPQVQPDVVVDPTPGSSEPNIAAARDGTLYIGNPGHAYRSDDGGATWTDLGDLSGGGDGDLAVDAAGNVYWLGLGNGIPSQKSLDRGATWSEAIDVSAGTGVDREWIDVTPDGKVYATWRGDGGLEFNASLDGGATWLGKVIAGPDGDEGPVVADPVRGVLYIPSIDLGPLAGLAEPGVHVYTSRDDGATWTANDLGTLPRTTPVEPNGYNSDFPVIAVDSAGTAYLVYSADSSGFEGATPPEEASLFGIFLRVSLDQGTTWSDPVQLSTPGRSARFPWVAAGAPGRIAVVWYENRNGVPSETLPDLWDVKLWESITADTAELAPVVVNLNSDPSHIGSVCTSGTGCLAADRSLLDFFEVALAPNGQPVVAWASSALGTGIGLAAQETQIHFSTVQGTPLR